jgi:hypothetical protein
MSVLGFIGSRPQRWSLDGRIRHGSSLGHLSVENGVLAFQPPRVLRWFVPAFERRPVEVELVERGMGSVRFRLAESVGGGVVYFRPLVRHVAQRDALLRTLAKEGFQTEGEVRDSSH